MTSSASPLDPEVLTTSDMSLAVAEALLAAVQEQARSRGLRLAAAVVDRGGNLVACIRMDHAQLGAGSVALDKAFTAVAFQHPTAAWSVSSAPGGSDWGLGGTLGGRAVVFPGGLPVYADGVLVGGIGVSGTAATVDEECAGAAVAAVHLATAPTPAATAAPTPAGLDSPTSQVGAGG